MIVSLIFHIVILMHLFLLASYEDMLVMTLTFYLKNFFWAAVILVGMCQPTGVDTEREWYEGRFILIVINSLCYPFAIYTFQCIWLKLFSYKFWERGIFSEKRLYSFAIFYYFFIYALSMPLMILYFFIRPRK